MIVKKHISKVLKDLEKEYRNSLSNPNPNYSTYFAKLAILECCGWIEEALDSIVRRSVKGKLKTSSYQDSLDGIIKDTHGFEYKGHFRKMMTRAIGLEGMENIERYLDKTADLVVLIAELEKMTTYRNEAAHTWGVRKYPSPSNVSSSLETIYPILKKLYTQVTNL